MYVFSITLRLRWRGEGGVVLCPSFDLTVVDGEAV
jgi:hypothetical protein